MYMSKIDNIKNFTPQEIVSELDKYVVGQNEAKRAVATAFRNRWRRKYVDETIKPEIIPHNILMIGPTGVGKTEIARRIATLAYCPFIKVEATKFTEIGYVGRDVDSIIRDLLDIAMNKVHKAMFETCKKQAAKATEKRILDVLVGDSANEETRDKFKKLLTSGQLDNQEIEIELKDNSGNSGMQSFDVPGGQLGVLNIGDMLGKALGTQKTKNIKTTIKEAKDYILEEESNNLIDEDKLIKEAKIITEEEGIVFLDELDKIANRTDEGGRRGEVSREGVQRDLLPLIEGSIVNTKYGPIKTDHILFIASGAFHFAKPSDLLPELQGRLPVRVELQALTEQDMVRILSEPKHNLPKQYQALFLVENVKLEFTKEGIERIAAIATEMNKNIENIGARRLHTVMEKLFESISFTASETPDITVKINSQYVKNNLENFLIENKDHYKFIL